MVFTNAQTHSFFTDADQMGLSDPTVNRLATKGITAVGDLSEFSKENINNLATTTRRDPAAPAFGVKSQKRIIISANLVYYYELIGRTISHVNMRCALIGKNFEVILEGSRNQGRKGRTGCSRNRKTDVCDALGQRV